MSWWGPLRSFVHVLLIRLACRDDDFAHRKHRLAAPLRARPAPTDPTMTRTCLNCGDTARSVRAQCSMHLGINSEVLGQPDPSRQPGHSL